MVAPDTAFFADQDVHTGSLPEATAAHLLLAGGTPPCVPFEDCAAEFRRYRNACRFAGPVRDADAFERVGCFAVVLEAIPNWVATLNVGDAEYEALFAEVGDDT